MLQVSQSKVEAPLGIYELIVMNVGYSVANVTPSFLQIIGNLPSTSGGKIIKVKMGEKEVLSFGAELSQNGQQASINTLLNCSIIKWCPSPG